MNRLNQLRRSFITAVKQAPDYIEGDYRNNSAALQLSHLVRNGADARRLLVPILDATDLSDAEEQEDAAEELSHILQAWDEPTFSDCANRAKEILDQLDDLWTAGNDVDMMELAERRVALEALSYAITQRCETLKDTK